MEIRRLKITGLVQGVGYRYGMTRQARQLGIAGWVRNLADGSVEATIAGQPEAIAAIIHWARRGPSRARVDHIAVELDEGSFAGFEARPDA